MLSNLGQEKSSGRWVRAEQLPTGAQVTPLLRAVTPLIRSSPSESTISAVI